MIQKWENSTLSSETYDNYTGEQISYFFPLKNGGMNFTDKDGEGHYISGGIIIVDNIRTINQSTPVIQKSDNDLTSDNNLTAEYENLKKQYSEKRKYLKQNRGKLSDAEVKSIKSEMKTIMKRIQEIKNILYNIIF